MSILDKIKKPMKILYMLIVVALPIMTMGVIWVLIDDASTVQIIQFWGMAGVMGVLSFISLWLVTD